MTSHLNIDWEGTRELNRRNFNTNARWNLTHNSDSHIATQVYDRLLKDGGKGTKYESDPLVSIPHALRKDLHRRDVDVEAQLRAKGDSGTLPLVTSPNNRSAKKEDVEESSAQVLPSSPSSDTRRSHCHRKHKKNCPKHLMNDMRRRKEAESLGMSPLPYSEVLDGPNAIPCTIGLKTKNIINTESNVDKLIKDTPFLVGRSMAYVFTGSYDPTVNVRKHRMEDEHPNFTKNEKKVDKMMDTYRSQLGASRWGSETFSPKSTFAESTSPSKTVEGQLSPAARLAASSQPFNSSYDGTPKKIPVTSTTPTSMIAALKETPVSRLDGPHRHLSHTKVVPEKLVKDEHDPLHFRKRYDMKTHMEKMRSMGPGLLREFANGKGFK